jgi:hypothetical protein
MNTVESEEIPPPGPHRSDTLTAGGRVLARAPRAGASLTRRLTVVPPHAAASSSPPSLTRAPSLGVCRAGGAALRHAGSATHAPL